MANFTPVASAIGGALIGVAATMMLTLNGRIAGISGILGGTLRPKPGDVAWRVLFLVGLIAGGAVFAWLVPDAIGGAPRVPIVLFIVAGLLVGAGTQLGNGCTSGHGVCGISRLSKRCIVATMTFMATGAATVFVVRHVLSLGAS
jgi:uncharacterized membrane protein YedE/YeeE